MHFLFQALVSLAKLAPEQHALYYCSCLPVVSPRQIANSGAVYLPVRMPLSTPRNFVSNVVSGETSCKHKALPRSKIENLPPSTREAEGGSARFSDVCGYTRTTTRASAISSMANAKGVRRFRNRGRGKCLARARRYSVCDKYVSYSNKTGFDYLQCVSTWSYYKMESVLSRRTEGHIDSCL